LRKWFVYEDGTLNAYHLLVSLLCLAATGTLFAGQAGYGIAMFLVAGAWVAVVRVSKAHIARRRRVNALKRKKIRWAKFLYNKLGEGEDVRYAARKNPVVIFHHRWTAIGALALVGSLALHAWVLLPLPILGIAAMSARPAFDWWCYRQVFTNRRIILIIGFTTTDFREVWISKIEKVGHSEPFVNKVLVSLGLPGLWNWRIDTLAQEDDFNNLPEMTYPSAGAAILAGILEATEKKSKVK